MQNDTKRRIISTAASEEDIRNDDTLRPKFRTEKSQGNDEGIYRGS